MLKVYPYPTVPVIDTYHDLVHQGKYFSGGYYNSALADAATLDLLVQTSADHLTHTQVTISASGDSIASIYEDTTFSAAGTSVTMTNHNRASAKVFSGTVTHTPTITGVGTALNGTGFLPGGGKHNGSGGDFSFNNEFVLAKSKNYLYRITNISGVAIKISVILEVVQSTL